MSQIYLKTPSGNGQKWLMIDVEDEDEIYHGVFSLLDIIRKNSRCKADSAFMNEARCSCCIRM